LLRAGQFRAVWSAKNTRREQATAFGKGIFARRIATTRRRRGSFWQTKENAARQTGRRRSKQTNKQGRAKKTQPALN
jgi:hypothetical protein